MHSTQICPWRNKNVAHGSYNGYFLKSPVIRSASSLIVHPIIQFAVMVLYDCKPIIIQLHHFMRILTTSHMLYCVSWLTIFKIINKFIWNFTPIVDRVLNSLQKLKWQLHIAISGFIILWFLIYRWTNSFAIMNSGPFKLFFFF